MKASKIPLTPTVRTLVRHSFSLGIGFVVALAPLIGAKRIPGFRPLADLFPESHKSVLIPISAALLSLIAVSIQFFLGEKVGRPRVRKWFLGTLVAVVLGMIALVSLQRFFIVTVGCSPEPVIIGFYRLSTCECGTDTNRLCIQNNDCEIARCWDENQAKLVELFLYLSYLAVLGGFEILVGLLMLQEKASKRLGQTPGNRRKRSRKKAALPVQPGGTPQAPAGG